MHQHQQEEQGGPENPSSAQAQEVLLDEEFWEASLRAAEQQLRAKALAGV